MWVMAQAPFDLAIPEILEAQRCATSLDSVIVASQPNLRLATA